MFEWDVYVFTLYLDIYIHNNRNTIKKLNNEFDIEKVK